MSKVARSSSESDVQLWETEEDDMTEGDLGYGLRRKPGSIYEVEVSQRSRKKSDGKNFSPPPFPRKGEERSEAIFQYSMHKILQDTHPQVTRISNYRQQSNIAPVDSNAELSNEELRQCLHETLEEVEILKTELEASQRQLRGKEEALKILQSMAILGKATSHTQAVLQKTMEQKRSLEKEINALQWEIEFDHNRFKNIEESWTQKYDRLNCENEVLKENLKVKTEEIKMLKSDNAACSPRSLPLSRAWREPLFLCQNGSVHSETASSAQTGGSLSSKSKKTFGQRLLGMLPSENSSKRMEDQDSPQEVLKMLIDLLNDKEEALAHQRKVSYMLARALEDKDTASKENKEKNPMKENFPFNNAWHKTSELSVLGDAVHSSIHILNSMGCMCSIQHSQIDTNYRTLKRSHSLPSSIIF
ncbi:coiled-coil domain-containing protein 125 isoform X4 [Sapajus apella]|uniref:Coiled-coil domain-containing protein 125 isoform X4 n=1 Tax=Sapajus apella TaxID=9515 RepID=A0A6J3HYE1_SAPAP|nr:coiled-coil domain-containing protein 125 isoform X4 [Sapajus apella]